MAHGTDAILPNRLECPHGENNGRLDLIRGAQNLPPQLENTGLILLPDDVRLLNLTRSQSSVSLTFQCYAGHTYRLQRASSPGTSNWTDLFGTIFTATADVIRFFTDSGKPSGDQKFYRLAISP